MTRREWQLILKGKLTETQYRYVDVDTDGEGGPLVAFILDVRTMQPVLKVSLEHRDTAVATIVGALEGVRPADPADVTIIPHWPGP